MSLAFAPTHRDLTRLTEGSGTAQDRLSDLIEDGWRIYFESCLSGDLELHAKANWAAYVAAMPDEELLNIAEAHLEVLDRALAELDI